MSSAEYMRTRATRCVDKEWLAEHILAGATNLEMAQALGIPREVIRDARKAYNFPPERRTNEIYPTKTKVAFSDEWPAGARFQDDPRAANEIGLRRIYGGVAEPWRTNGSSMT